MRHPVSMNQWRLISLNKFQVSNGKIYEGNVSCFVVNTVYADGLNNLAVGICRHSDV